LFRLILLFTILPLVELSLLLRIGEWLGAGATIGLVVATGVAGAWLARREGARTWRRVQAEVAAGRLPGEELLHALLVFVAGVVLVTPGVITDALGLLLLARPARALVARRIRERLSVGVSFQHVGFGDASGVWRAGPEGPPSEDVDPDPPRGRVIEVPTEGPSVPS